MPTLPTYNDLGSAPRATQSVVSIEANPVNDALSYAGGVLKQMEDEKKKRDDLSATTAALNDADAQLRKSFTEEGGYLTRLGENANNSTKEAQVSLTKIRESFLQALPSREAQDAFSAKFDGIQSNFLSMTARNEHTQKQVALMGRLEARAESSRNNAILFHQQPEVIAQSLADLDEVIELAGIENGDSTEKIELDKQKARSATFASIAMQKYKTESPDANQFLAENAQNISADEFQQLEVAKIKHDQDAEVNVYDKAFSSMPLDQLQSSGGSSNNPEVNRRIQQSRQYWMGIRQQERNLEVAANEDILYSNFANQEPLNQDALDYIKSNDPQKYIQVTGAVSRLAAAKTQEEIKALKQRVAYSRLSGKPVTEQDVLGLAEKDPAFLLQVKKAEQNDRFDELKLFAIKNPAEFRSMDLSASDVTDKQKSELIKLQKDDKAIKTLETSKQALDDVLFKGFGLDPDLLNYYDTKSPEKIKSAERARDIRRRFDSEIMGLGDNPAPQKIREVADRLLIDVIYEEKRSFFGYELSPKVTSKKGVDVKIEGVPSEKIDELADMLRLNGDPVTPENIKQLNDKGL